MKIKNLNVFDAMRKSGKSICVGVILICLSLPMTGCTKVEQDIANNNGPKVVQQYKEEERILQPYESIISVPVKFTPTYQSYQWTYHPGYKCVGIGDSTTGRGNYLIKPDQGDFGGACLLFVNDVQVRSTSYTSNVFGDPVVEQPLAYKTSEDTCVFYPGQHILSIEIADPTKNTCTYESHPGYAPIGIATTANGKEFYNFTGAIMLFTNVEKVECKKDVRGKYTTFGTIVEEKIETETQEKVITK